MEAEQPPHAGAEADKLAAVFAEIGAPKEVLDQLLVLTKHFGPELLTAVLGYLSICLINKGSSKYGELEPGMSEEERREITKEASSQITIGGAGMAATAFAAGNALFAYPEVVAVLGSLKPYLESVSPAFAAVSQKIHLDTIVKATAIGVGGYVTYEYAQNVMQALPPLSLTALSVAFSGGVRQEIYRVLTLTGGTGLVVGSAYSAIESHNAGNPVGAIMSLAFLALNALFTHNEWKVVEKMGGVKKVVAAACDAVWQKVKGLFGKDNKKDNASTPHDPPPSP